MRRPLRTLWRKIRLVMPHAYVLSGIVLIYLILDMVHVLGGERLRWG